MSSAIQSLGIVKPGSQKCIILYISLLITVFVFNTQI